MAKHKRVSGKGAGVSARASGKKLSVKKSATVYKKGRGSIK